MANINKTKDPGRYNLATGLNMFSLQNTDSDKPFLSLRLKENDIVFATLKNLPNTFNVAHSDVSRILSYKLGYNSDLETITQCSTSEDEVIQYEAFSGYYLNNQITGESSEGEYIALNGRKDLNLIDWNWTIYPPVFTPIEQGPIWVVNRISDYKPLTDRDLSKKVKVNINDFYTLTYMNDYIFTPNESLTTIIGGISRFGFYFYDNNDNLIESATFYVNNIQTAGGGPATSISSSGPAFDATVDSVDIKYRFISVQVMNSTTKSVLNANDVKYFKVMPLFKYSGNFGAYTDEPVGQGTTFVLTSDCTPFDEVQFSWINSLGFRDYFTFNQKHEVIYSKNNESYERLTGSWSSANFTTDQKRSVVNFNGTYETSYTTTSDWLTDDEMEYLNNLLLSPNVNVKLPNETEFKPVNITDRSWTSRKYKNDRLFQLTINYKEANKQKIQNG